MKTCESTLQVAKYLSGWRSVSSKRCGQKLNTHFILNSLFP